MQQLNEHHAFTGMQKDKDMLRHPSSFLYDAKNIRLDARFNKSNLQIISNEKGNTRTEIKLKGNYLGHTIINNYLIIFSHSTKIEDIEKPDSILRVDLAAENINDTENSCKTLYNGNLKFSENNKIQTLSDYENEKIQKVYWVDGINPARVINIVSDKIRESEDTQFDFSRRLKLEEKVTIRKNTENTHGDFPNGVIQYALTYYSNTGTESAIFYTSPLLYITEDNTRGGSPESKSNNTFTIKVENLDTSFDYCRIYSLIRTSLNGDVIAKKVIDIPLENIGTNQLEYTDDNYTGEAVEAQSLLYKGSKNIIGQTIAAKDGTLFMGNLFLYEFNLTQDIRDVFRIDEANPNSSYIKLKSSTRNIFSKKVNPQNCNADYVYTNQLTAYSDRDLEKSTPCGGFKRSNYYRCGIQFQDKFGNWSEPIFIGDFQELNSPTSSLIDNSNKFKITLPTIRATLNKEIFNNVTLNSKDFFNYYKKARPVVVFPQPQDRVVVCQGVAANTLWSNNSMNNRECYPDWFFSSVGAGKGKYTTEDVAGAKNVFIKGNLIWLNYAELKVTNLKHEYMDASIQSRLSSIRDNTYFPLVLGNVLHEKSPLIYSKDAPSEDRKNQIGTGVQALEMQHVSYDDWCWRNNRVINMYSPDIEFDFNTYFSQDDSFANLVYKHVGNATVDYTFSNVNIQRNNDGISGWSYLDNTCGQHTYTEGFGASTGYYFWDTPVGKNGNTNVKIKFNPGSISNDPDAFMCWPVYLWQRKGSLTNDTFNGDSPYADLKKKQILNIRYADTTYLDNSSLKDVKFRKIYLCNNLIYDKLKGTDSTFNKIVNYSYSTVDAYGYLTLVNFRERTQQCSGNEYIWPDYSLSFSWQRGYTMYTSSNIGVNLGSILSTHLSIYNDPFSLVRLYNGSIRAAYRGYTNCFLGDIKNTYPTSFAASASLSPLSYNRYDYSSLPLIKILKYLQKEGTKTENQVVPVTYKTSNCLFLHWMDREDKDGSVSLLEGFGKPALNITEIRVPGEGIEGKPDYRSTMFGGTLKDALLQNSWIPCGEPVNLKKGENIILHYAYGDTYYQRWDCVKTNARSLDDINQLVEIGSFMLETYVNIDGRWDRTRGDNSNAYISEAFNSVNEVYSQHNNFFSYRILNDTNYSENLPAQFTWTKEKQPTADIDAWTNFTLASTYNVEGSKGPIITIVKNKDKLYCFQEKGISVILFNSRVQIPVSDGVPIEIANNYKVDGVQYISDGVGCSDKFLIANTPTGIYFIDSVTKHLFHLGETLRDLTTTCGMATWFDDNNRVNGEVIGGHHIPIKLLYDELYKDVYVVYDDTCLCYSEKFGQFISFFDYPAIPLLEHYKNKVYTLGGINSSTLPNDAKNRLYIMFDGEYNSLFPYKDNLGAFRPNYKEWSFTLVGNGSDSGLQDTEKIFTNLDYRVDTLNVKKDNGEIDYTKYDFDAILSEITVSNEYQTASQKLQRLKNESNIKSYHHKDANLQRKNRIWRIQLPTEKDNEHNNNGRYMYRIRGPWCKVSLTGRAENKQVALYDLNLQYYI